MKKDDKKMGPMPSVSTKVEETPKEVSEQQWTGYHSRVFPPRPKTWESPETQNQEAPAEQTEESAEAMSAAALAEAAEQATTATDEKSEEA